MAGWERSGPDPRVGASMLVRLFLGRLSVIAVGFVVQRVYK